MGKIKPSLQDLEDSSKYELLDEIPHQDMLSFVMKVFATRNILIHSFVVINLGFLTASISMAIQQAGSFPVWKMIVFFILGAILGTTLVIPPHEGIHGLVYRLLGARKISFGWNPRHFYFYVAADRFVVGHRDIWPLAMAPFLILSTLSFLGIIYGSPSLQWISRGFLCMHSLNCIGDFAMVAYFWQFRKWEIYTFDLVKDSVSFIYRKI